ncbi:MAG TPA: tRNA (cytidine(34)-2'-O)-methyltransferase [bacterium]|jgi:tRNA (cytidine/uridine-2'-O-)-methyltransferase|nr:tRNA (cytidine(34)-2'-O)-methyltransferase [bacterium]
MFTPRFEIVLVRPEIAGNTGNIGRTCMALGCRLHLVHPLGYTISDANLRRAGMDYWPLLEKQEHASLEDWMASVPSEAPVFLLSTKAGRDFKRLEIPSGATLVFGNEGHGLPEKVHERWRDTSRRVPMDGRARSLNLSSCVSLVLGSLLL